MKVFVEELVNRGHDVSCLTSISMGDHQLSNYTEILIDPPLDIRKSLKPEDLFKYAMNSALSPIISALLGSSFIHDSTKHALENENVRKFIHNSNNQHFDLIISEELMHDALLMLGKQFNAPIVAISPFGMMDSYDHEMGLLTPVSHVSNFYTEKMDFSQRWYNTFLASLHWLMRRFVHCSQQAELVQKHFSHLAPLPSIDELRKNISIVFVNSHRAISHPRPMMPGLIYIGGAHIKPPKPLPADLQKFLDESKHGVIYFSLGTIVTTSKMPKDKLDAILETLGRLKQRVIWKFEDESGPNIPENVLIRKWLPQSDILAHPNVILFISHGGLFSNFEAVNYGIQMLVIPIIGDQYRNAHLIESAGYGKQIHFNDLSVESLHGALDEMLNDPKFRNRAKEVSAIFKDNLVHPMEEFLWWIEHVIKFPGTKHFKSHAADMSLFKYLLLDVMLVNLAILLAVIFGTYYVISRFCSRIRGSPAEKAKRQ